MTMVESDLINIIVMPALCRHPPRRRFTAMRERNPCVYIMASGFNGTLYIGVTSNLIGRVMQHRDGTFEGFTKRYSVKRLVWFDTADTMDVVIAAEKRIKKWPRDFKKNLIERDNPKWDDLAIGLGLSPLE
jgi:putative endonuclease